MYYLDHYVIDWDKVKTLEDVKRLLAATDISFEPDCQGLHGIGDLVRLEKKKTTLWPRDHVLPAIAAQGTTEKGDKT
jgi:hypothetical protein